MHLWQTCARRGRAPRESESNPPSRGSGWANMIRRFGQFWKYCRFKWSRLHWRRWPDAKLGNSSERARSREQSKQRHLTRLSNSDLRELLALGFCLLGGLAGLEGDVARAEP